MTIIAPSILSADFSRIGEEICLLVEAGAEWIHLDVMDGHFVPNLTFGAPVIRKIRHITSIPFDVHLMVLNPEKFINDIIQAGADIISVHIEATNKLDEVITQVKKSKKKIGLSLKPNTPIEIIKPYLDKLDLVLIMSVEPGFGGQQFIPQSLSKIKMLNQWRNQNPSDYHYLIEVDGGINDSTASSVRSVGADVIVTGSYIFNQNSYVNAIETLRSSTI